MILTPGSPRPATRRRPWLLLALGVVLALMAVEGYRVLTFYQDVSQSKQSLLSIKSDLDLTHLEDSPEQAAQRRQRLEEAGRKLRRAESFVKTDPFLNFIRPIPVLGDQASALKTLVIAARESTAAGITATDVALAFSHYDEASEGTSIEKALAFLQQQQEPMAKVAAGLSSLQAAQNDLPDGRLIGPLASARDDLDEAITKLSGLVTGYQRANSFLPELLGYNGERRYLVLPQNDTELMPSGGLISSYGIVTFNGGRLVSMDLEYFGTLFDRWQAETGEYIEPPGPLKNYLKQHYSWGLGEAGWYPDFPTTAGYARMFVEKGGAPPTDGTIAIDLKFISALLDLLGPVEVPEYGVTVTAQNVQDVTLEWTRDETYIPGQPKKAFLSYMARSVLDRLFSAPKDRWLDMLQLLDRMGRERHLQMHFDDTGLQELSGAYGFDGSIIATDGGDYLMIADASVNSTKLNLILETTATLDLTLKSDGSATSAVSYGISNPFPEWKIGRDQRIVKALMLDGVYGCYLRLYTPSQARLRDVKLDGRSVGPEQAGAELGKMAFGRFFPVLPGTSSTVQFIYDSAGVIEPLKNGSYRYRLYLQKEAGTGATPLAVNYSLPANAKVESVTLDGKKVSGASVETDLAQDREIEIVFRLN